MLGRGPCGQKCAGEAVANKNKTGKPIDEVFGCCEGEHSERR